MRRQDVYAEATLQSAMLLRRYLAGFDEGTKVAQAPGLPNHAAWSLGHLALTMHRVAERLDKRPMPETEFVPGQRGDEHHFAIESVAFGSRPAAEAGAYPTWARCVAIFDSACERLASAWRGASEETLEQMTPWGNAAVPTWSLANRIVFHNGMHCGQIADLRRALGFGSIFA